MKRSELQFKNEFVGRCVFDKARKNAAYCYDEAYARRVSSYLRKAKTTDEFIDLFLADQENVGYQSYVVMLEYERPAKLWYFLRQQMGATGTFFKTEADAGAVKIGNTDWSMLVSNGKGDGTVRVCVAESRASFLSVMRFAGSVQGTFNVYSYDCGDEIAMTLSGRFGIYVYEGLVAFERWS